MVSGVIRPNSSPFPLSHPVPCHFAVTFPPRAGYTFLTWDLGFGCMTCFGQQNEVEVLAASSEPTSQDTLYVSTCLLHYGLCHGENTPGLAHWSQEDARCKAGEEPGFVDHTWRTASITQEHLPRIVPWLRNTHLSHGATVH